jgi:thiol-disulfide isomerase/thioredoxin
MRTTIILQISLLSFLTVQPSVAQQSHDVDSVLSKKYKTYFQVKGTVKKEKFLQSLISEFPPKENKKAQNLYKRIYTDLAISWLKKSNLKKYSKYRKKADESRLNKRLLSLLHSWATQKKYLDLAKQIGKQPIDYYSKQKSYYSLASANKIYGTILKTSGDVPNALKYYKAAYKSYDKIHDLRSTFITNYAKLLTEQNHYGEALNILVPSAVKGKYNKQMINQIEQLYGLSRGNKDGLKTYIQAIKEISRQRAFTEVLSRKKVNETKKAPDFSLQNLNGDKVSLKELRGKVVVLDFWATWCGPCRVSLPGMQRVVNKYFHDPKVKILFIDAGEHSKTPKKVIQDFLNKNGYNFEVLLYDGGGVKRDYGIRGIPTKYVIGPSGNILFRTAGANGLSTQEVNKISAMIEIAKDPS